MFSRSGAVAMALCLLAAQWYKTIGYFAKLPKKKIVEFDLLQNYVCALTCVILHLGKTIYVMSQTKSVKV